MSHRGRLIGDVFASMGALLVIAGPFLLTAQYFVWLRTDIWYPIRIRTWRLTVKAIISRRIVAISPNYRIPSEAGLPLGVPQTLAKITHRRSCRLSAQIGSCTMSDLTPKVGQ